jgi:HK97 family phage portal protein
MSFLDRAMSAVARLGRAPAPQAAAQSSGPGSLITTPQELEAAIRGGNEAWSGVSVTAESAMKVGAVYASVRLLSGTFANMPVEVYRRLDDTHREIASDNAVRPLLRRRPNRWQTPSQFKRMLKVHELLRGNAYAQIVWSIGRPIELIPMHPDRVQAIQLPDLTMQYVYTRPDGRQVMFDQHDVLHLMGLSLDGVRGVTPITYARETIGSSLAADRYGANMYRNGAQMGGYLSHPQKLGNEARVTLKSSLDDYRAEGAAAGKWIVLEEGMTAEKLGMTAEDAQWIEARKLSRSDVAMYFGVPPSMIGDNSGSDSNWGTGLEQKVQSFLTFALEDHLIAFEETVERDLIDPSDDKTYVLFNRKSLIRGDIRARYAAYASALQWGWMSPDEVRALEDMNPRNDDEGDQYYPPPNTAGDTTKGLGDDPAQSAKG